MDKERFDTAAEPVDQDDDEFMDTGVLHELPDAMKKKADKEEAEEGEGNAPGN